MPITSPAVSTINIIRGAACRSVLTTLGTHAATFFQEEQALLDEGFAHAGVSKLGAHYSRVGPGGIEVATVFSQHKPAVTG